MTPFSFDPMRNERDSASERLFGAKWLPRFQYLTHCAKRAGSPLLTGRPRKLAAGGTEATGVRDYCPGDDLRYVDWNWCARRDEVLTKTFEGVAERHVAVLLDVSQSMGVCPVSRGAHGVMRRPKFRLARQVAAAAGCWALLNMAAFSLIVFSDDLGPSLVALRERWQMIRLLQFLERLQLQMSPTNLPAAVAAFVRLSRQRGPVIVISDLLDCQGYGKGLDMLRYHGFEPRVVHLVAPEEANPPWLGDVQLVDCETGARYGGTVTERARARYRKLFERFTEEVRTFCRRRTVPCLQFSAETPEEQACRAILGLPGAGPRNEYCAAAAPPMQRPAFPSLNANCFSWGRHNGVRQQH